MFLPNSYSQKSLSKPKIKISDEFEIAKPLHKNSSVLYSREDRITDGMLFGNSFLNNLSDTNKYNIKVNSKNSSGNIKEKKFLNNSSFDLIMKVNQDTSPNLIKDNLETTSMYNKIIYLYPNFISIMIMYGTISKN